MTKLASLLLLLVLIGGVLFGLVPERARAPGVGEASAPGATSLGGPRSVVGLLEPLDFGGQAAAGRVDVVEREASGSVGVTEADESDPDGQRPSGWVRIAGWVVDEAGQPVAGRALKFDLLSKNGIRRSRRGWEIGDTDADGNFVLEGPPMELGAIVLRGGDGPGVLVNRVLPARSAEGVQWVQLDQVLVRGQVFGAGVGGDASLEVYEHLNDRALLRRKKLALGEGGLFELPIRNQGSRLGVCVRTARGNRLTFDLRSLWRELGESRGGVVELGALDFSEDAARVAEWLLEQRELDRGSAAPSASSGSVDEEELRALTGTER